MVRSILLGKFPRKKVLLLACVRELTDSLRGGGYHLPSSLRVLPHPRSRKSVCPRGHTIPPPPPPPPPNVAPRTLSCRVKSPLCGFQLRFASAFQTAVMSMRTISSRAVAIYAILVLDNSKLERMMDHEEDCGWSGDGSGVRVRRGAERDDSRGGGSVRRRAQDGRCPAP